VSDQQVPSSQITAGDTHNIYIHNHLLLNCAPHGHWMKLNQVDIRVHLSKYGAHTLKLPHPCYIQSLHGVSVPLCCIRLQTFPSPAGCAVLCACLLTCTGCCTACMPVHLQGMLFCVHACSPAWGAILRTGTCSVCCTRMHACSPAGCAVWCRALASTMRDLLLAGDGRAVLMATRLGSRLADALEGLLPGMRLPSAA
jgi:hypothetical protein